MYPTIEIFGFRIFTFGTTIAFAWLIFIVLLHQFAWKKWFTKSIFSSLASFTLAIFLSARLFYILSEWVEQKFTLMELTSGHIINFSKLFFTPQEYFFSLFGGIVWFFIVFIIKTHSTKKERLRYLDVIIFAFLYSAIIWYFWALLWGQVYGIPFNSPISLVYNHKDTIIKEHGALFPLPIFYMAFCLIITFFLSSVSKKISPPDGFIGLLWIWLFGVLIFFWEFLSGSRKDMFYDIFYLNLNQIGATIGIVIAIIWILRLWWKIR